MRPKLIDAILMAALVPLMAIAFVISIPPIIVVIASWRWRKNR